MERKFVPWMRPAPSDQKFVPAPRRDSSDPRMISAKTGQPVGQRLVSAKELQRQEAAAAALKASPALDPKERRRWKDALRLALRQLAYARQVESGETRKSGDFVVLNVDRVRAPQSDDERGVFLALIDELTAEDDGVRQRLRECMVDRLQGDLDDFDRGLAQRAGLPNLSGQPTRHAPSGGLMGKAPPLAGFDRADQQSVLQDRPPRPAGAGWTENPEDLCHPGWYMGFWTANTYLTFQIAPAETSHSGARRAGIGPPVPGQDAEGQMEQTLPSSFLAAQGRMGTLGRVKFQFGGVSGGPIVVCGILPQGNPNYQTDIATYVPSGEPPVVAGANVPPAVGGVAWKEPVPRPAGVDRRESPAPASVGHTLGDGILTVWNAEQWRYQIAPHEDHYNTDLFDRVHMTIEADEAFYFRRLAIVLNDVEIARRDFGWTLIPPGQSRTWDLDEYIAQDRLLRLLYRNDANRHFPDYDPQAIMSNPVLAAAAQDLAQGWSGKYDARWHYHHGRWLPEPGEWCSEFVRWCLRVGRGLHGIKDGELTDGDLMAYFASRDRWLCANNLAWEHLGERIRPGYYASVKNGGHSVLFMYWLQPNYEAEAEHKTGRALHNDVELGPTRDAWGQPVPWRYDPTRDINWFMAIGGNQGGLVTKEFWAVVSIGEHHGSWVSDVRESSRAMIWRPSHNRKIAVFDGFGDSS